MDSVPAAGIPHFFSPLRQYYTQLHHVYKIKAKLSITSAV